MRCHSCDAEVHDGQKFCMECGASLRGVADITGEVPLIRANGPVEAAPTDERTREMAIVAPPPRRTSPPPPPPPPVAGDQPRTTTNDDTVALPVRSGAVAATAVPPQSAADRTSELHLVEATTAPVTITTTGSTGEVPVGYEQPSAPGAERREVYPGRPARQGFRLRPLLILAIIAAGAVVVGVLATVIEIDPAPDNLLPQYVVNDFGTNNTIAALIAAGAMVVGSFLWCFGLRWGAGLAGGAGAALAGWAALLIGLAEWPIAMAETSLVPAAIERSVGYWALLAAGGLGGLVFLLSLTRAGGDGRSGLNPWIAALGAVSFLIAAGGPLIPEGTADWSGNYSSESLGVDLPTSFFVGRGVQLGLLALCGVVGFLLVRRYGLGLAIGGAVAAGWMLVTSATDQTASPIGPAYENPGSLDLQPHAVTIVGFALVGFFALVAVVMALLDADR